MQRAESSSSSPAAKGRVIWLPLDQIHPHPKNANEMSEELLTKLAANIKRQGGEYPPLVVRPHPTEAGAFQLLDGHQRLEVLRRLGHSEALCFVWDCDDETALVLLASLNRLHGEDLPVKRAQLLGELSALMPEQELALLLPESAAQIGDGIALLDLDADALLADLEAAAARSREGAPRLLSFAVLPADEALIEEAIAAASAPLEGRNTRGRALALVAGVYLEEQADA